MANFHSHPSKFFSRHFHFFLAASSHAQQQAPSSSLDSSRQQQGGPASSHGVLPFFPGATPASAGFPLHAPSLAELVFPCCFPCVQGALGPAPLPSAPAMARAFSGPGSQSPMALSPSPRRSAAGKSSTPFFSPMTGAPCPLPMAPPPPCVLSPRSLAQQLPMAPLPLPGADKLPPRLLLALPPSSAQACSSRFFLPLLSLACSKLGAQLFSHGAQQQLCSPLSLFPSAAARGPCSDSSHGAMIFSTQRCRSKNSSPGSPPHRVLARSAQSRPAPSRWCLRQPRAVSSICAALASRRQKSLVSPSLVFHCFWISSA